MAESEAHSSLEDATQDLRRSGESLTLFEMVVNSSDHIL